MKAITSQSWAQNKVPSHQHHRERWEAAHKALAEEDVDEETGEEAANKETAAQTRIVEDAEKAFANDEKLVKQHRYINRIMTRLSLTQQKKPIRIANELWSNN